MQFSMYQYKPTLFSGCSTISQAEKCVESKMVSTNIALSQQDSWTALYFALKLIVDSFESSDTFWFYTNESVMDNAKKVLSSIEGSV